MEKNIIEKMKKDKIFDYYKENTYYTKELIRNPNFYDTFKKIIKEKYNLKISDKVTNVLNDIELVSNIISTIN